MLDHLFRDAWNCGALAVHWQLDPMHVEDLRARCCFYRRGTWLLVHSRDSELHLHLERKCCPHPTGRRVVHAICSREQLNGRPCS